MGGVVGHALHWHVMNNWICPFNISHYNQSGKAILKKIEPIKVSYL
jgi:hypothetical protein